MNRYSLQRRPKGARYSDIEDPAFRSHCISLASTGASRRTVAGLAGKPEATLRGWINRGLAHPGEEPYGSFAVAYCRAEKGILGAIAGTAAYRVQLLHEQMRQRLAWEQADPELRSVLPPPTPDVADMLWLEKLRASRAPEDYGTSKHRKPEAPYDAQEWLDAHTMEHEQLAALFSDPPDSIRGALVAAAPAVYAILLAGGFDPAQRKATNGQDERARAAESDSGAQADAGDRRQAGDPDPGGGGPPDEAGIAPG